MVGKAHILITQIYLSSANSSLVHTDLPTQMQALYTIYTLRGHETAGRSDQSFVKVTIQCGPTASCLSINLYMVDLRNHYMDCHGLSQDFQCICVHYTLCLNHTLIQTYCPTIILGIPMAILDTITGLAQSCAIYRAHAIECTYYSEDSTG